MKKMRMVGLVIGLIGVLGVGNVMAASANGSIDVFATIEEACSVVEESPINFNSINPVTANGDVKATGGVTIKCTEGTSFTFDTTTTDGTMTGTNVANTLNYSVAFVDASGTAPTDLTPGVDPGEIYPVTGTLTLNNIQNAVADSYSGTYSVTINFP